MPTYTVDISYNTEHIHRDFRLFLKIKKMKEEDVSFTIWYNDIYKIYIIHSTQNNWLACLPSGAVTAEMNDW